MSGVFEHSIKVPRLYKTASKILKTVREDGASLKQLVYLKQHPNLKALYALVLTSLRQGSQLDQLIRRTKILVNEPRLDAWLTRVLITELLWGKKRLSSECKPVKTLLKYENTLREELKNVEEFESPGNELKRVQVKPRYVRINTLSMSVEEAIEAFRDEGWRLLYASKNYPGFIDAVSNLSDKEFIQDINVPELLVFPPKTQFYNHPGYTSGSLILQDKASCLPAYLLNAQPGSTVLDMCAAPGMKTTHLASILNNEGKIYAIEIDQRRYQTLREIVTSTDCHCVETVNADVMTLGPERCPNVEYILVDPSCSGSGMVDRPGVDYNEEKCAPGRLRNLQSFQVIILRHALLDFPTVKRVVYSTCSLYSEENEEVVDEVLSQVGDAYTLIPAKSLMKENWLNYSSKDFKCGENCLYARPDKDFSNGFFVAVFERNFDIPLPVIEKRRKQSKKESMSEENFEGKVNGENIDDSNEAEEKEKEKEKKRDVENIEDYKDAEEKEQKKKKKKKKEKYREKLFENSDENCVNNVKEENEDDEVNIRENNCGDAVPNKDKKSKRKRRESKEETEAGKDNEDQPPDDDEVMFLKKKKKCKKSRNPEREIEFEEEEAARDDEAGIERKKKSKKSKKINEPTEPDEDQGKKEVQTIDDNADIVFCKKRKKNKV